MDSSEIWQVADGKLLHSVGGGWHNSRFLAFSPDSTRLLTLRDERFVWHGHHAVSDGYPTAGVLWDVATGKNIHELRGHLKEQHTGSFSADGKLVAIGSRDGTVIYWDSATGDKKLTLVFLHDQKAGLIDWLVATPEGLYDGSERAAHLVSLRIGDGLDVVSMAQMAKVRRRPGLMETVLQGDRAD